MKLQQANGMKLPQKGKLIPHQTQAQKNPFVIGISAILVIQAIVVAFMSFPYFKTMFSASGFLGKVTLLALGLVFAVCAFWILFVGHHFFRGMRWTRLAIVIIEAFAFFLGISLFSAAGATYAIVAIVPAVIVIIGTLLPSVVKDVNKKVTPGKSFT
ncbi:MAG: hypothetical protein QM632_02150 [Micrococcaceae bacterium]